MEVHNLSRNPLADTYNWFAKAVPRPKEKNVAVQLGVHFEEVAEMLEQIQCPNGFTEQYLADAIQAMEALADHFKKEHPEIRIDDRIAFLDSITDQLVTATGSAYMLRMDPVGGLIEVNESNYSKFVDGEPVFNEDNKIMKGPNYRKPVLDPFV